MSEIERQKPISSRQRKAINALLKEPTTTAAAEVAEVSPATIWRWLKDPAFDEAYQTARDQAQEEERQAREQIQADNIKALHDANATAIATLCDVMSSTLAAPAARVSAAKCVLDLTLRVTEAREIEERLRELEARFPAIESRKRA